MWARRDLKSRLITYFRRALSIFLVVLATCAGAYLPLVAYHQSSTLSVGEIRMSVSPGHRGALDVYVPLVDWGARFEAIRAPLRIRVDLQTVNRGVATGLAQGQSLDIDKVRAEAEQALTTYLMRLIALTVLAGAALGLLVAFAIRSRVPRLRWTAAASIIVALGIGVALALLIPPRGEISNPQYYAHGPDIPRALEAVEAAQRTPGVLDQELDAQLVGLARLVVDPGRRAEPRRPADDHGRLRPAQQHGRARRAGAGDGRRAAVLRRRPDRPRFAARDEPRPPRRAHGRPVRVRLRQPRLRLPLTGAGQGGRDRAHPPRPAEGGRHAMGRSSTRSRACAWRATTTRSSARAPTRTPTASTTPRNRACRRRSCSGCAR